MKKFSVLIALALLAVAGTGYAVTCAQDNVPAATLLVPYWKVSRNGSTGGNIPGGGIDTLVAITNVSSVGIIVHAALVNKYSRGVLDWNIPMTGYDVAAFSLRDVLNGNLNSNPNVQNGNFLLSTGNGIDPCGVNFRDPSTATKYVPRVGMTATRYIRFSNPDAVDRNVAIGYYNNPAFSGSFRTRVWDSLDESGDVTSFTSPFRANILDEDNPQCYPGADGQYSGDFSGYLYLDVVNYCTNYFIADTGSSAPWNNDVLATLGWGGLAANGVSGPNVIMGDVFFVDTNSTAGNISGDHMVPLEFDARIYGTLVPSGNVYYGLGWEKSFYEKFWEGFDAYEGIVANAVQIPYAFVGDGREPLGNRYGFRYVNGVPDGAQSWATIWRSDTYTNLDGNANPFYALNLCYWWIWCITDSGYCPGLGLYNSTEHPVTISTYDMDENQYIQGGGPSGGPSGSLVYVFLESARYALLNNAEQNPANYVGGWTDIAFGGYSWTNNSWVGIQHTAPGAFLSVGHSATLINGQFTCPQLVGGDYGIHDSRQRYYQPNNKGNFTW